MQLLDFLQSSKKKAWPLEQIIEYNHTLLAFSQTSYFFAVDDPSPTKFFEQELNLRQGEELRFSEHFNNFEDP